MEIEQFAYSLLTRSPAHQPREPAAARRAVAGRLRALAGAQARAAPHPVRPMLLPLTVRGLHAQEPHRRLADGDLQRGRRRAAGLPPGAPGRAGARRRGAGVRRDDQPDARGPHHARLHRACTTTRSRRRSSASSTSCTRQSSAQDRHAARPQRPQGLDPARLGRHRRAACRRATGRCWPPARCAYGEQNQVPAAMTRADMDTAARRSSSSRPGARPRPASTGSNCTARTATCWRPSSAR